MQGDFKRLEPNNVTYDITEGLQAKVKDPLWMLGRQYQMGEFTATNGGHLIRVEADYLTKKMDQLLKGTSQNTQSIDLNTPLERYIEKEEEESDTAWNQKHLEYRFKMKNSPIELTSNDYHGNSLDWYHFDLSATGNFQEEPKEVRLCPSPVKYYGMPSSRFWVHEDGRVNLGDFTRPHFNILTMLLIDFALISSQDYYLIPLDHQVGEIRKMTSVNLVDSFGVYASATPAADPSLQHTGFEVFTMTSATPITPTDPSLFYFPHTLIRALESKSLEEVSFFRDEMANLVWAIEHRYENEQGKITIRDQEHEEPSPSPHYYWNRDTQSLMEKLTEFPEGEPGNRIEGPVPLYLEKQLPPLHWIPYIQQIVGEQVILRRARTSSTQQQYQGTILAESSLIAEEEISRSGIKITRLKQLARKCTGEVEIWTGRQKGVDRPQPFSQLAFDQLKT